MVTIFVSSRYVACNPSAHRHMTLWFVTAKYFHGLSALHSSSLIFSYLWSSFHSFSRHAPLYPAWKMLVLIAVCWQERILRFFTASDGSEESAVGSSWNLSSIRATVQRRLRWMENNWLARKTALILIYSIINDAMIFYEALRGVYWPSCFSLHPIRSSDVAQINN